MIFSQQSTRSFYKRNILEIKKKMFFNSIKRYCTKSFNEIPGPPRIPFLGSSWKYLPFIGEYEVDKLHIAAEKKLEKYGPIVREEVIPGMFVVNLFDPEDIEKMYKYEGKYPARRSHLGVLHYRSVRPHMYNSGGIIPVNGDEWWRLRSNFQKSLSKIKNVRNFLPQSEEILDEFFIKFIDGQRIDDFLSLISRLNLELTWLAMFGERLGSFEDTNLHPDSIPSLLMKCAETANSSIISTDSTEKIWTKYPTKSYKILENCLSYIEKIVHDQLLITQKRHKNENCLIEQYFSNSNIDFKDILGMAVDLVLGGVDTTSYTSCFIVYHLSNNFESQKKLNEEASRLLKETKVTAQVLNDACYARAILKESFRLNPIAIGVSRNIDQDVVFGNYLVPKGTLVITQNLVACRQERYFKNAQSFVPERWIKGSSEYVSVSPYLILPFSHGPRTCIARRLAEQNLLMLILKIGKNYNLKWLGGNLGIVTPLICKPDSLVSVEFIKRH